MLKKKKEEKVPLEEVLTPEQKAMRKARKIFLAYLRKEGPYAYCKLAKEIESKSDEYINHAYGLSRISVEGVLNGVFGDEYAYQETIDSFLENIKRIPNYAIHKPNKKTQK